MGNENCKWIYMNASDRALLERAREMHPGTSDSRLLWTALQEWVERRTIKEGLHPLLGQIAITGSGR